MNTWFRKVGMGAVALTLAGVLGGCNNGGGAALLQLFFGINGSGNCNSVIVDVNLSEAGAVIARDSNGDVQCALNDTLDAAGCNITFQEVGNGDLRATVSGCTIPGKTNLFSCLFEDVDISSLQETATAQCDCKTAQGCDSTPPVCISTTPDPGSCENCTNGIDDDHNGLTDCDDPNCSNNPACASTTTTSTTNTSVPITTSSTNTTTTTSSTTTSVTTEPPLTCNVILHMASTATVGALQFHVNYANAPGEFLGSAGNVECADLTTGGLTQFNDVDAQNRLNVGMINTNGFTGPTNLAQCTFKATTQPVPADFTVITDEASDPATNPIDPLPAVDIVSPIVCSGPNTTTTTLGNGGTTTTLNGGGGAFTVKFTVAQPTGTSIGALQLSINYAAACTSGDCLAGEGEVTGNNLACTNLSGQIVATNDVNATSTFNIGVISVTGFDAPKDLVSCTFTTTDGAPAPGDFVVTVTDATAADQTPIPTNTVTVNTTVTPKP